MSAAATPRPPGAHLSAGDCRIATLMGFEAATLAVFAVLHLSGALRPGSGASNGPGAGAGVAEAIICVVLVLGLRALVRSPARGRLVALGATAFAILGFIVGLTFTVDGGATVDLVYHLTMFPILIVTALMLARGVGAAALGGGRRSVADGATEASASTGPEGAQLAKLGREHPLCADKRL